MTAGHPEPNLRELIETEMGSMRTEFALRTEQLKDGQDRIEKESVERLERIEQKVDSTNGRVKGLEMFRGQVKAIVAIGLLITPFVLDRIFG